MLAVRRAERDRSDATLKQAIAAFLALGGIIIAAVFWQMKRLWRARGEQVRIGASLGIAFYPAEAATDEALLRHAHPALQCAKRRGTGRSASIAAASFADIEAA